MKTYWRGLLFVLGVTIFILSCPGMVLFSPALAEVFFDRISFKEMVWSPDGSKLAFLADTHSDTTSDFFYSLYVVDADGENLRQLTPTSEDISRIVWSPDGKTIAGITRGANPPVKIYSPDGDEVRTISDGGSASAVDWSPDGSKLAVISNIENGFSLYIVDVNGENREYLYKGSGNNYSGQLHWSPDGTQIAFRDDTGLYAVDVDNAELHTLVYDRPSGFSHIHWEGEKVVFSGQDGTYEIDADGGELEKTSDQSEPQEKGISPDGDWRAKLACSSPEDPNNQNLDVFPCRLYELRVVQVADNSLRFTIGIEDVRALSNPYSRFVLLVVVAGIFVGPGLSLPYFFSRKNWFARLFIVVVLLLYSLLLLMLFVQFVILG